MNPATSKTALTLAALLGLAFAAPASAKPITKLPEPTGGTTKGPVAPKPKAPPKKAPTSQSKTSTTTTGTTAPKLDKGFDQKCQDFDFVIPKASIRPDGKPLRGFPFFGDERDIRVQLSASLEVVADRLLLDTKVTYSDTKPGGTILRGVRNDEVVFDARTVAPNCRIVGVSVTRDRLTGVATAERRKQSAGIGLSTDDPRLLDSATCRTRLAPRSRFGCNYRFVAITVQLAPITDACESITLTPPDRDMDPFTSLTRGDAEMAGNPATLTLRSKARIEDVGVQLVTEGKIEESVPDHTTLEETDEQLVFRSVPNCRVTSVEPATGLVKATTGKNDHRQRTHIGEGQLRRARCKVDGPGKDHGKVGCGRVSFRPITINLEPR